MEAAISPIAIRWLMRAFRLRLPERVVLGHVAQEADEQQATTIDRSNRQFDGKLLAILSDGGYLDATAQHCGLAARKIALQSVLVGFAIALGNDEIRHRVPDRFLARPAEHVHSLIVPIGDDPVVPHDDHRIERGLQDEAQCIRRRRSADRNVSWIGVGGHGR
jgi:hypothetical protein